MTEESGNLQLTRYLLGELPEDQAEQIEQKYFSDDQSFEELQQAEAELIDAFVAGTLDSEQRKKFENLYLTSTDRRRRVVFAEALHVKALETTLPEKTFKSTKWTTPSRLLVAVLAIFALAGVFMIREILRLQAENESVREELRRLKEPSSPNGSKSQDARIEELTKELDSARLEEDTTPPKPIHGATPQPAFLSVVMAPGLVRDSSGMKTLILERRIDFIRFELKLDRNPFKAYRVSLQTAAGEELWNIGLLTPSDTASGKSVLFDLPSNRVAERDYVLLLQGKTSPYKFENVSAYPFRLRKAP